MAFRLVPRLRALPTGAPENIRSSHHAKNCATLRAQEMARMTRSTFSMQSMNATMAVALCLEKELVIPLELHWI